MYEQVVEGISSARKLPPAAVQAVINAAPLLPSQALQMQLLDGLLYRCEGREGGQGQVGRGAAHPCPEG
jgi:hypothetical protein